MLSARLIDFLLFSRPLDCNARPYIHRLITVGTTTTPSPPIGHPRRTEPPYLGAGVDNPETRSHEIFLHEMRANFPQPRLPPSNFRDLSLSVLKIIKSGLEF